MTPILDKIYGLSIAAVNRGEIGPFLCHMHGKTIKKLSAELAPGNMFSNPIMRLCTPGGNVTIYENKFCSETLFFLVPAEDKNYKAGVTFAPNKKTYGSSWVDWT
jgi:hypothetical protein